MKLLHNFVSLGFVTLLSEAAACSQRSGMSPDVFIDVLAKGGGSGAALDRLRPYILAKDPSGLQFTVSNALKDLTYYNAMAEQTGASQAVAKTIKATLAGAAQSGHADAFLPELVSVLSDAK